MMAAKDTIVPAALAATEPAADVSQDPSSAIELAPTLQPPSSSKSTHDPDPYLVTFTHPHDPANPLTWPRSKKWAVTDVLSATGFIRIMVSTILAPALPTIAAELSMSSTESAMALSIYLLATAFGPFLIGPLSEIYGRQKVLHTSNVWFLAWNVGCGFARTKGELIASRFMAGFGASAIYALAGGVLGDVWRPEERGRSLGVYLLIPLLGSAVGPIIGGFMAARTTWRWMFWATSAFQAVMIVVSFGVYKETYAPVILGRKAEKLRKETGDQRYQTAFERLEYDVSPVRKITRSLMRPLRLLAFHPIIQIASLLSALSYGTLYILLSTFSDLWTSYYGESVEISGLHYIAIAGGEIFGAQVGGPLIDFFFRRIRHQLRTRTGDPLAEPEPEQRIPLMFPGAFAVLASFLLYGWTAEYRLPWIVVDVGIFLIALSEQLAGLPQSAYVIDAYAGQYTSSALAASQFLRSLTAFLFPLFGPQMYDSLGYGWGNTLLGIVSLVAGLVGPYIIWRYGAGLRARAQLT